jgi:lipopolysaccharide/colanic/teichoic acid biosynthesis glycosyltransferase
MTDIVPRYESVAGPTGGRPRQWAQAFAAGTKRSLDVLVAALLLVLLLPLLTAIAILVRANSKGPALFRQRRVGRLGHNGTPSEFTMLKFRSMVSGADETLHKSHVHAYVNGTCNVAASSVKIDGDPRVTSVGRVLRRWSLDELPQLLNVLRGEMSIVGPRPVPPYEAAYYDAQYQRRFTVRPGITGSWQVSGRSRLSFHEMMSLDLEYIDHKALFTDLKIIMKTIPAAMRGDGAK